MTRADALIYGHTRLHQSRVTESQAIVRKALSTQPSWYIALSGGKDSICVIGLVREQAPGTIAQFSARDFEFPDTLFYLRNIPNLRVVAYAAANDGEPWATRWDSEQSARVVWPDLIWVDRHEEITELSEAGVFLGLRADEAGYRDIHLRRQGTLFLAEGDGKWRCNPIAWWSVLDVWAYILCNGLTYNRAYDVMDQLGIPLIDQRIGPYARGAAKGAISVLRLGWPQLWNEYAARHPEARAYA